MLYFKGDKPEDFGKQRCWGSISWAVFSVLGGATVDYFSEDDLHKNYVPIYFLCLAIILCDFALATKIEVSLSYYSTNEWRKKFENFTVGCYRFPSTPN